MGHSCSPYLQLCGALIGKQPQRTMASGRDACTPPQRVRTCGGTGPAGPTAVTGGLSGPSAPTDPGPCCLPGVLTPQCGGWGWREELQEAPGASLSHLGPSAFLLIFSFKPFCLFFWIIFSFFLLLMCPCFVLQSCFSSWFICFYLFAFFQRIIPFFVSLSAVNTNVLFLFFWYFLFITLYPIESFTPGSLLLFL